MVSPKPKRGCEIVVETSGDTFPDGMKKIGLEIDEDYHRFIANPEKWFTEYVQQRYNLTEEEAMKISQFFGGLFSKLSANFNKSTGDLKTATESKSIGNMVTALGGIVEVAAKTVEQTSSALKDAGHDIQSEDKHALAKSMVVSVATKGANKLIDIPGVNEDQEEQLFGAMFGGLVDVLIKSVVKKLNKTNGWTT